MIRAARIVAAGRAGPREAEALRALVLAVQTHYPSLYERIAREPSIAALAPGDPDGRLVKLARIARAILGEYL